MTARIDTSVPFTKVKAETTLEPHFGQIRLIGVGPSSMSVGSTGTDATTVVAGTALAGWYGG